MRIKDLPVRSAVPTGGFVVVTEPWQFDQALSVFAKVPASAVDVTGLSSAVVAAAEAEADGPVALMVKDETACIRCGLCAARCPTGAMTMERYDLLAGDGSPAAFAGDAS